LRRALLVAAQVLVASAASAQSSPRMAPPVTAPLVGADPTADTAPPGSPAEPSSAAAARADEVGDATPTLRIPTGADSALRLGGYVEAYYGYNFNRPANGITEFRAFDNRHNTIALQAIAADLGWSNSSVAARLVLQGGTAPDTYYGASEPSLAGTALTPGSSATAIRFVQQANFSWFAVPRRLTFDAGLFLSPIGAENMATNQNFTWSHSLMFFGLPFYHTGARVQWTPNERHALRLGVYNGWNNALDNNDEKTIGADYTFTASRTTTVGAAYFTGVERPRAAPEGRAWRHLLDLYVVLQPIDRLQLLLDVDGGVEPNAIGLSGWAAGNAAGRVRLVSWLFVAARGTVFAEQRASKEGVVADPIAIPAGRVMSGTLTLEARPERRLSFKLEGRRDVATAPVFFSGSVAGDGSATAPYVPNAKGQTTVTLGGTAWF
jgi:hypothetical protein